MITPVAAAEPTVTVGKTINALRAAGERFFLTGSSKKTSLETILEEKISSP